MPDPGFGRPDDAPSLWTAVLSLQPGHPGQQGLQADTHEIGHHRVVLAARPGAADDLPGHPDDYGARRHLLDHDGVGADPAVVADFDRAENLGSGADRDAVTDGGVAFTGHPPGAAEGDAVEDRDVFTHLRGFPDHHAGRVVDEQAGTEYGGGVDLDAGQDAGEFGKDARGQPGPTVPQPVADPVAPDGVYAGVGEDDLQRGRGGRIALLGRLYVTPHRRKHG